MYHTAVVWSEMLQGKPFISQHCIGAVNSEPTGIETSFSIHGDCHQQQWYNRVGKKMGAVGNSDFWV